MYKKVIGVLLCLVFLLSISCVVANENISGYSSLPDDIEVTDENSEINDVEINDDESFDEFSTSDDIDFYKYDETGNGDITVNSSENYDFYDDTLNEIEDSDEYLNEEEIKNTTGIVMSDNNYSCGSASLATVLNTFGLNLTLKEVSQFTDTNEENGTSMLSLIETAKHYGFEAFATRIDFSLLNENYIVHMTIDGNNHWSVFKHVTDDYVFLADPNEGNIRMSIEEFMSYFTGEAIIISNNTNENIRNELQANNIIILKDCESSKIVGKRLVKKLVGYKKVRKWGFHTVKGWHLRPKAQARGMSILLWEYVYGPYQACGWYYVKVPVYKTYTYSDDSLTKTTKNKKR